MYTTELNVDAALHELFSYARQYQYEVRFVRCFSFIFLFDDKRKVTTSAS